MRVICNIFGIMAVTWMLTACAGWSKQEIGLEVAYTVLHVADWGQTRYIAGHPAEPARSKPFDGKRVEPGTVRPAKDGYEEINPILGRHPSKSKVDLYFGANLLAHWIIADLLPNNAAWPLVGKVNPRKIFQAATITIQATTVAYNASIGVEFEF